MLTKTKWPRKAAAVPALVLALALGCQPSGPQSLLQGQQFIQSGQYQKALASLQRAEPHLSHHPQLWNHFGLAYHGLRDLPRAAQSYQHALKLDRNLAAARYNLGVLYLEQNQLNEAVAELNSFVLLQPNNAAGLERLGTALVRLRRPDDAERMLVRALRIQPKNASALNSLGLAHLQRKRPREAMQAFNAALQAEPGYAAALLNQAVVAQQAFGDKPGALERYRAYLATNPPDAAEVQRTIAQIEAQLAPKPVIAAAPTITNTVAPTNVFAQAVANIRSNVAANAIPVATNQNVRTNAVAAGTPTNAPVVAIRTNPAVPLRTNVITASTSQPPPRTNIIVAAAKPKDPEPEAEPELPVEVVKLNSEPEFKPPIDAPTKPATNPVQVAAAPKSDETKPLFAPRRTENDKPGLLDRVNPMRLFRRDEKEERAVPPPVRRATQPTYTPPPQQQARPVAPARNYPRYQYRKNLNVAAGNRPNAERLFDQGARAHAAGKVYDAIALYRDAIAADPSYHDAHYNLGVAAFEAKDLPLALAASEQAVVTKPNSTQARYNFAIALRSANYPVDAANELREMLVDAPDDVRAHFALANLYAQHLDETVLARRHYQRVLELNPAHPEAAVIREWLANAP